MRFTRLPAAEGSLTLDPDQGAALAAIVAGEPVVRVIGGPGTGKSTLAHESVVRCVETGRVDASQVLLVASSRVLAAEMRARVTASLARTTTQPLARTLPSLAFGVLRRSAALAGDPPPRLLSGPEQDVVLRDLLAGHEAGLGRVPLWPDAVAGALATRGFRGELRDLLMRCAELDLGSAELRDLGDQRAVPEWTAASVVLKEYEEVTALSQPGAFDPAGIIGAAIDLLETDDDALRDLAGQARLVVVDDAQDLTLPGARLLEVLRRAGSQLVLIGDPDVTTQVFRGADPALFLEPEATVCLLGRSHRHTPAVHEVVAQVADRIGVVGTVAHRRPSVVRDARSRVDVVVTRTAAQEAQLVAERLRRAHLVGGMPWSQMAVIVRGAARTAQLRLQLAVAGVPVSVPGAHTPLRDEPAVRPLLRLLEISLAEGEEIGDRQPRSVTAEDAVALLSSPVGGVDAVGLRVLRRALRADELHSGGARSSDELLAALIEGTAAVPDISHPAYRAAGRVADALSAMRRISAEPLPDVERMLWAGWSAVAVASRWKRLALQGGPRGVRADRDLDAVVALFAAAADYVDRLPGQDPAGFLHHIQARDVAGDSLVARAQPGETVTLTTPAGSAGRQWSLVAVCGVQDGVWPDPRLRGTLLRSDELVAAASSVGSADRSPDPGVDRRSAAAARDRRSARARVITDETRLFHVAVSRACDQLLVTAVSSDTEAPSAFLDLVDGGAGADESGHRRPVPVPDPLSLSGTVASARRAALADDPDAVDLLALLASENVPGAHPDSWWVGQAVSSTGPRRADDVPVRLSPSSLTLERRCALRWFLQTSGGQRAESVTSASVGTLIHDIASTADPLDVPGMLARLDERWDELGLPPGWLARRERSRAAGMLERFGHYAAATAAAGWEAVDVEADLDVTVGRARIRGRVDRVERRGDEVRIVDLKTGSAASVPSGEALVHPQLAAYQVGVAEGAFGEGARSAGARLVFVGKDAAAQSTVRDQPPLEASPDPQWAHTLVTEAAQDMAGSSFTATPGDQCRRCPVRASCPAVPDGSRW